VKVRGERLNVSQFHPLGDMPKRGQRVNLQVERTDRASWIEGLEVLDYGTVQQLAQPHRSTGKCGSTNPRDIRVAVLKAAAAFAASRQDVKSSDVLTIADR
jgi:hypothetical protein